jgi:hypothetical protein
MSLEYRSEDGFDAIVPQKLSAILLSCYLRTPESDLEILQEISFTMNLGLGSAPNYCSTTRDQSRYTSGEMACDPWEIEKVEKFAPISTRTGQSFMRNLWDLRHLLAFTGQTGELWS